MVKRLDSNVVPMHNDKYYVYALFKPNDFNPFYVGKGIRGRVNEHFKKSNLKGNSPKIGIIKKYGNSIRREILAYFDSEQSAYDFEEYLISLYGLQSEGGYLVNYAKTRFQYSDKFTEDISSKGHLHRERIYSKEVIKSVLRMFYLENKTLKEICNVVGMNSNYLPYVLRGEKCKHDYKEFMEENPDIAEKADSIFKENKRKNQSIAIADDGKISDELIFSEFEKVCSGIKTIKQSAIDLEVNESHLGKIFLGKKRVYLNLDYERYKNLEVKGGQIKSREIFLEVSEMLKEGLSVNEIIQKTGYGRTTIFRIRKKLNVQ